MPPSSSSASWNDLCASSASVPRVAILSSSHSSSFIPDETIIDDNDLLLISNDPSIFRITILLIIEKSKGGQRPQPHRDSPPPRNDIFHGKDPNYLDGRRRHLPAFRIRNDRNCNICSEDNSRVPPHTSFQSPSSIFGGIFW